MKKQVTELKKGDIIDPPAGEKCWLWKDGTKRRYTVLSVVPGMVNKRGSYVKIVATVESPYSGNTVKTDCQMIETKKVTVRRQEARS
jgi:hypothetical protein